MTCDSPPKPTARAIRSHLAHGYDRVEGETRMPMKSACTEP